MRTTILLLLISFVFSACEESKEEPTLVEIATSGIRVKVIYGAGDSYDVKDAVKPYLPLPFNIATKKLADGNTLDFIILSNRIFKGQELQVIPIGALRLSDDGIKKDYYIAIPVSNKRQTFKAKEFSDFAVEYAPVKWMIEQYFTNYKGFSKVKFMAWEDEQYALRKITSSTSSKTPKG